MGKYSGDYKISDHAYRELYHFCLRYNEFKDEIKTIMYSGGNGGIVRSQSIGGYSDPTANKAIKIERLRGKCELIEQTAIEAAGDYETLYQPLLLNVTTGISYEHLRACGIVRDDDRIKGKNKFYDARRKFFWLLDYRKNLQPNS